MKINELRLKLEKLGVPRRVYSLSGWSDERLCLEKRDEVWDVFFVERGQKRAARTFETEDQACEYMLDELKYEVKNS